MRFLQIELHDSDIDKLAYLLNIQYEDLKYSEEYEHEKMINYKISDCIDLAYRIAKIKGEDK